MLQFVLYLPYDRYDTNGWSGTMDLLPGLRYRYDRGFLERHERAKLSWQ
jgi:hypothetical protein